MKTGTVPSDRSHLRLMYHVFNTTSPGCHQCDGNDADSTNSLDWRRHCLMQLQSHRCRPSEHRVHTVATLSCGRGTTYFLKGKSIGKTLNPNVIIFSAYLLSTLPRVTGTDIMSFFVLSFNYYCYYLKSLGPQRP